MSRPRLLQNYQVRFNIGSSHAQNSEISPMQSRLHAQWPELKRRCLVLTSGLRPADPVPPHPVLAIVVGE